MTNPNMCPHYHTLCGWNAILTPRSLRISPPTSNIFDLVIIGAGITGLIAAKRASDLEPGSQILLIDGSFIGENSAGRNTGFMINVPHNTSASGHGVDKESALKQIALFKNAAHWLEQTIHNEKINCDWNPVGKYHAAATEYGKQQLQANLKHYDEWGISYRELNRDEIASETGSSYYHYAYHSDNSIFVQPAKLVRGLLDALPSNVFVWENATVHRLDHGKMVTLETSTKQIKAPRVIVANNGFADRLGLAKNRLFTIFTYAAMTPKLDEEDLPKLGDQPEWGMIPANRLGSTLRRTLDGRMVIRSHYTYGKEGSIIDQAKQLKKTYQSRFPSLKKHEFEHVWGGFTALTRNGSTFFGEAKKNLYISVGCNGSGLLKGALYGKLLGEMSCGHDSPDLQLAQSLDPPNWLPPEPIKRIAVTTAIAYQKYKAGAEK